jgi:DNA polymerase III subunit epsilon
MHHDDWAVLDLETTGLRPDAEPVEIALVGPAGDLLLDTLVRPDGAIDPGAVRLHGLDSAALAAAPTFSDLYPSLCHCLKGRLIIAYWAPFDRSVLERACRTRRLPLLPAKWDCAHARYRAWRGFSVPLSTACEIEGIPTGTRHRAAADARLVWELLQRMPSTLPTAP